LCLRQFEIASAREVFGVLRVARGVAAFDEIDADLIQPLRDLQLVLQREADAFTLGAVAEGGVVDLDAAHGVLCSDRLLTCRSKASWQLAIQTKKPRSRGGFRACWIRFVTARGP